MNLVFKPLIFLNAFSENLYNEAQKFMPGGVNSPVRACRSVGRTPLFIDKAKGSYIYDVDGNKYIDYICSWGPNILGHCREEVINAVKETCDKGQTIKNFIYKKGNSNNTISLDIIIYILHHDFRHIKMFQVYQMA